MKMEASGTEVGPDMIFELHVRLVEHVRTQWNLKKIYDLHGDAIVLRMLFKDRELVNLLKNNQFEDFIARLRPDGGDIIGESEWCLDDLYRTHKAWASPFIGNTVNFLEDLLQHETVTLKKQLFAKLLPIIQSSGAGKSRLMDEFSKTHLGLVYTFRISDQSGYPPGDMEITKFLCTRTDSAYHQHANIVGLLAATIDHLSQVVQAHDPSGTGHPIDVEKWFSGIDLAPSSVSIPIWLHSIFAPKSEFPKKGDEPFSEWLSTTRSELRIRFCKAVVKTAGQITDSLILDDVWKDIFGQKNIQDYDRMGRNAIVKDKLIIPLQNLMQVIVQKKITSATDPAQLFIGFDEIHNLNPASEMFMALQRVMRLVRANRVWGFVLSTQSPLQIIHAAKLNDASNRIRDGVLTRVVPFHSFVPSLQLLAASDEDVNQEKMKPFNDFSSVEHLSHLGRPLWSHCSGMSGIDALEFVSAKLFCGAFEPKSIHIQVAFLSYRVGLDPCLNKAESSSVELSQVASHLRWINRINRDSSVFYTMTLEEPLVSAAAARAICLNHPKNDWADIIQGLNYSICAVGLIDKGRTGELVFRCVLMMARDSLFRQFTVNERAGTVVADDLNTHVEHIKPFLFTSLIKELFHPEHAHKILNQRAMISGRQTGPLNKTILSMLGGALCNFTHFACTDKDIDKTTVNDLLHQLFYNQAALQCSQGQKTWDQIIPIYLGNIDGPFDIKKVAVFVVQVKNKNSGTVLDAFADRSMYEEMFPGRMVISILLDLGLKTNRFYFENSYRQETWAFRITGCKASTFACLDSSMESDIEAILDRSLKPQTLQDQVAEFTAQWDHHGWAERVDSKSNLIFKSNSKKRKRTACDAGDRWLKDEENEDEAEEAATY